MGLLYHMARAGQCADLPLMIKLDQENQGFWAQAALGAGFKAVLYTDIRTPEDVETCRRYIRVDTPETGGLMGLKLRRPALGQYDPADYVRDLESTVFTIMIEKDLAVENIDAVLSAAGARAGKDLPCKGTDLDGVESGLELLKHVAENGGGGGRSFEGERVVVIGGGNTAIDVARVAKRQGEKATIIYRRRKGEMPARGSEVEEALDVGLAGGRRPLSPDAMRVWQLVKPPCC